MRRPALSFTITILIAFTLIFSVILALAVYGFRGAAERAAIATADTSLTQTAATVSARTNALVQPVLALIREVSATGVAAHEPASAQDGASLAALLAAAPEVRTASAAWPDGTLVQAAPASVMPATGWPKLPAGTAYVIAYSHPGTATKAWLFLDAAQHPLGSAAATHPTDPRYTQWYLQSRAPGVFVTTPYQLGFTRQVGLSVSSQMAGGGVVALDITLGSLGDFLRAQQTTPNSVAFLFSDLGIVLADPETAQVVHSTAQGRVNWVTLQNSTDPVRLAVWNAYASGKLLPGQSAALSLNGTVLLARLELVDSLQNPPVLVAVAAPRSDFTGAVDAAVKRGTSFALTAFLVGLVAIALMSWRIAQPLGILTREAQAIRRFELAIPFSLTSRITEVERLSEAIGAMKATLGSFAVYLPRDLVHQFLAAGTEPRLGGERVALSLMFSDIQGFTTIAETLEPEELTRIASAYFEDVTRELLGCGATIDKYIGDAVMAFWNAPRRDPCHAAHACDAVLRTRAVTLRLGEAFVARGWPKLWTRFGVHTGEAVVGNVGSSDRMAYTAMGGMVNLANRLEGLNKVYGTQILVSDATKAAAGQGFVFRAADLVVVKGTVRPMPIHELVCRADEASPEQIAAVADWEDCVAAYRTGAFADARLALARATKAGGFALATTYARRLAELGEQAVPGWSPVLRMTEK
jgi:adenylate cyclase